MNRGYIKLWRRSLDSSIFAHEGLWKLFCLCLMKATHKETDVTVSGVLKPIRLLPGQFITGRWSLHEDYHQAYLKKKYTRKAAPTAITLYRWLLSLRDMQILNIKTYNKFSVISICNWNQYQGNEQQMNIRRTPDEHKQEYKNLKKECEKILSNFSDPSLLDKTIKSFSSTRKDGKASPSVILSFLKTIERFPPAAVERGCRIYIEKGYAHEGKDEKYLLGIIRKEAKRRQDPETVDHIFAMVNETPEERKQRIYGP